MLLEAVQGIIVDDVRAVHTIEFQVLKTNITIRKQVKQAGRYN
jgi:hypothetical protein